MMICCFGSIPKACHNKKKKKKKHKNKNKNKNKNKSNKKSKNKNKSGLEQLCSTCTCICRLPSQRSPACRPEPFHSLPCAPYSFLCM